MGAQWYDWNAHRKENWEWWKQRMARTMRLFDIVRIDHFERAQHTAIPVKHKTARKGKWLEGPKDELIEALIEVCGSHECIIIAEDLGIIPAEVTELRQRHKLEGMSVLQFAFDDDNKDNPHKPENITIDRVVYTGTHDNNTTKGWWSEKKRKRLKPYMKEGESVCQTMIRLAVQSPVGMAIIPIQDIMELGSEARMNTPGVAFGNWQWNFSWDDPMSDKIEIRISEWSEICSAFADMFDGLGKVDISEDVISYQSIEPHVATGISLDNRGRLLANMPLHSIETEFDIVQISGDKNVNELIGESTRYVYRIPSEILRSRD